MEGAGPVRWRRSVHMEGAGPVTGDDPASRKERAP